MEISEVRLLPQISPVVVTAILSCNYKCKINIYKRYIIKIKGISGTSLSAEIHGGRVTNVSGNKHFNGKIKVSFGEHFCRDRGRQHLHHFL